MFDDITPLILTYNEDANIGRTLAKLGWAARIVVVDSGSSDTTKEIAARYPAVEVVERKFDDHASQWNFGLLQVRSRWALTLDADYELSDELISELSDLAPQDTVSGYTARFVYRVFGKQLRGTIYPARTVLFRTKSGTFFNAGHTQRVRLSGTTRELRGIIFHDDRKSLSRWIASQQRYAPLEASHLLSSEKSELRFTDRIRRLAWPAPLLVFAYTLFAKGCIFDGIAGWYYVLQRTFAEVLIALEIVDQQLRSSNRTLTPTNDRPG